MLRVFPVKQGCNSFKVYVSPNIVLAIKQTTPPYVITVNQDSIHSQMVFATQEIAKYLILHYGYVLLARTNSASLIILSASLITVLAIMSRPMSALNAKTHHKDFTN